MANLDLTKYGITGTVEIVHNPSTMYCLQKKQKLVWKASKKVR